jgi:predicted nucleic acid-binding protein
MSVFLDISYLLAVLDADDQVHPRARERQLNLKTAFAFDRDFATQGFETLA